MAERGKPAHATAAPSGACLLLGLAVALLNTTLPDAVLLPAVDRLPPRHLGLAIDGVLLSLGWWLAARRAREVTRTPLLLLGLAALLGCLGSAALLPGLHVWLAAGLRGEGLLPYYPLVALASAVAVAPAALPLGALLALGLGAGSRRAWCALLLGATCGCALAPWLAEVLLGNVRTLQVTALLCACATLLLLERLPRPVTPLRLPAGGGTALLAIGTALLVGCRLLDQQLDRGPLSGPALAGAVCLCACPGLLLARVRSAPLLLAAAVVAIPLLFPAQPALRPELVRDAGADLLLLLLVALPAGLLVGALLVQAAPPVAAVAAAPGAGAAESPRFGTPLALAPALLVLLAPLVSLVLLPRVPPRLLTSLLALLVVIVCVRRARESAVPLVAIALLIAASFAGFGPEPPPGSVPVDAVAHTPDGDCALVIDPATGRRLLALDGHAAFGRSAAQERRFALLPMLLHGAPQRVLVIASGFGETASAAWGVGIEKLHWLQPCTHPEEWDEVPFPGEDPPTTGSERQFLAVPRDPYDVIIIAPDPRAGRRGTLVGTTEFYELLRERLAPSGLVCQWWDLADTDVSDLKSVIASAASVFEQCSLLLDHPRTRRACVGLLLSRERLIVHPAEIDTLLEEQPMVGQDLQRVGFDGLSVACLVTADRDLLELVAPPESAVHDDRPVLAVRGALRPEGQRERLSLGLGTLSQRRRDPMPWIRVPPEERGFVTQLVRDRFRSWQLLFGGAQRVVDTRGPADRPFDMELPGTGPDEEADAFVQALAPLPDSHELADLVLGHAAALEKQRRFDASEHYLREAIATDPANPRLHFALGALQERRGRFEDAVVHYTSVLTISPGDAAAKEALDALHAAGYGVATRAPEDTGGGGTLKDR